MTLYVVTGPPAAGKTTWVNQHAQYGDIVIDYDHLAQALAPEAAVDQLTGDPADQPPPLARATQAARQAAIHSAITDHDHNPDAFDVYIVHATPSRQHTNHYRHHGAHIITCDPGYTECMRRAALERTPRQQAVVHDWYHHRGLTT